MVSQQKIDRIQRQMKEEGIDLLFLRLSHHVLAFLGYWSGNHAAAALVPAGGKPVLLVPETERENAAYYIDPSVIEARDYALESTEVLRGPMDGMADRLPAIIRELGAADGVIGLEESVEEGSSANFFGEFKYPAKPTFDRLRALLPQATTVDATAFITRAKWVKSPEEIDAIERAASVVCAGLNAVKRVIRAGMTETEISAFLEREVLINGTGRNGLCYSRCFSSVYSGPRSAEQWVHWAASSGRTVDLHDVVIMEVGSVSDGYWCDLTRLACAGQPSDKALQVLELVCEAQRRGIERIQPGLPIREIDIACHQYLTTHGYGPEYYKHGCGHGVGYNYHEGPPVHQACDVPLEEGMVLCVEPGVYIKGEFGIRMEDMVAVTRDGCRLLSHSPRTFEA